MNKLQTYRTKLWLVFPLTMFCFCGWGGEANVSEWYYEFKWNDKPLVPITSTNVLRIPELTPERNGDYQCIAHHNIMTID